MTYCSLRKQWYTAVFLGICLFHSVCALVTITNLSDFQVLQRTTPATADFAVAGVCNNVIGSHIQVRIVDQITGAVVQGFNWVGVDTAISALNWKGMVRKLPVGGEYALQVRQIHNGTIVENGATTISHVLVGDLWGAAGQSNMQGCGRLDLGDPPLDQVHVITADKGWAKAVEPISGWGRGPTFPFALSLYTETKIPIGLVYYAKGATSMDYWQKDSLGFFYWTSVIQAAGGKLKGVIWYQGESNSTEIKKALRYKKMTQTFMADIRNYVKNDSLPWILAQIATMFDGNNYDSGTMVVREAQREIGIEDRFAQAITTIDLKRGDPYHFDTPQYQVIGRRFAEAALTMVYGIKSPMGPRFQNAFFLDTGRTTLFVSCTEASGRMVFTSGANWLFAVHNQTMLYPTASSTYGKASIIAHFDQPLSSDAVLGFGYGQNPVECALTDSSGIPLQPFYNQSIATQGDTSQAIIPDNNKKANIVGPGLQAMEIRILENPFGLYAIALLSFPPVKNSSARLSLFSIGGIPVLNIPLIPGQNRCTISKRFLPAGCYVVRVTDGNACGAKKLFWRFGSRT